MVIQVKSCSHCAASAARTPARNNKALQQFESMNEADINDAKLIIQKTRRTRTKHIYEKRFLRDWQYKVHLRLCNPKPKFTFFHVIKRRNSPSFMSSGAKIHLCPCRPKPKFTLVRVIQSRNSPSSMSSKDKIHFLSMSSKDEIQPNPSCLCLFYFLDRLWNTAILFLAWDSFDIISLIVFTSNRQTYFSLL